MVCVEKAPDEREAPTMTQHANEFDAYAFSNQPGYDERAVRREFAKAVPLRTVVYCYDPRAVGIPAAVAEEFGDVFPGAVVRGDAGGKASTLATASASRTT
jgi:carbonic anhydrase